MADPAKILVVDDERNLVRLVQVNLERAGYVVIAAYDGKEALEVIARERPDLVVLDVMMPELDGFTVLERLRGNPETSEVPVVMLTARAQDEDYAKGLMRGADVYLTKPFNPNELVTFVRRLLSRDGAEA